MKHEEITIIEDDELSEPDMETRVRLADLDHRLLESEKKLLESERRRILLAHESKRSRNKRSRQGMQVFAGAAASHGLDKESTQDQVNDESGCKRVKLEPEINNALAPIDLSTPSPVLRTTTLSPRRRANVNYAESDSDSDTTDSASTHDNFEQLDVRCPETKHTYQRINDDYPSICKMPDGSLAELRCTECGANATFRNSRLSMLEAGVSLQRHYIASHRDFYSSKKPSTDELMKRSVFKTLSAEEANMVEHGTPDQYFVESILPKRAAILFNLQNPAKTVASESNQEAVATSSPRLDHDEDDEEEEPKPFANLNGAASRPIPWNAENVGASIAASI